MQFSVLQTTFKLFGHKQTTKPRVATYQPGKSLSLAYSLHQHHHFLFLRRECRKFLSN